jgi:hypothetical protein
LLLLKLIAHKLKQLDKNERINKKLNDLQIIQVSGDWQENIPEDIWKEYFENFSFEEVAFDLNIDTHRWYETSTTVIRINGIFMGINYITNMFSEAMDYEDCYHHLEFMEMEEFQTVSYREKGLKTEK